MAASRSRVEDSTSTRTRLSNPQDSAKRQISPSSPIPGSFDYYVRLAESRITANSPEKTLRPETNHGPTLARTQQLREVIARRSGEKPDGGVLALLEMDSWVEILHTYDEEIGLQYPFLDIGETIARIQAARVNKCRDDTRIEDVASLMIGLVSCLALSSAVEAASPLVHDIFSAAIVRVHTDDVDKDDLHLLILACMFFFLSDREVQAWRCIGTVMRLLHELCHRNPQNETVSGTLYWTVYTLDRRWSFGTGLPFAVSDSEVMSIRQPALPDTQSLSTAYLKQMVAYSEIASDVRRTLLEQRPESASNKNPDAVRDFADYRLIQWQKNLPRKLRFRGVDDKYDPAKESRGEYKLRLMLYLRANQMRTIILRKSATVSASLNPVSIDDASSTQTILEIAQDTIRVLVYLGKETDIYHAQHRTFNHFLETALSFLLLVVCCVGPSGSAPACLSDVVAAMDLIRQLSQKSGITLKLHEKLKVIRETVDRLKPSNSDSQPTEPAVETEQPGEGSTVPPRPGVSTAALPEWPSEIDLDAQHQPEFANPPAAAWNPTFGPNPNQNSDMTLANVPSNEFISPYDLSSNTGPTVGGEAMSTGWHVSADFDGPRFRELNDILMDYENFSF